MHSSSALLWLRQILYCTAEARDSSRMCVEGSAQQGGAAAGVGSVGEPWRRGQAEPGQTPGPVTSGTGESQRAGGPTTPQRNASPSAAHLLVVARRQRLQASLHAAADGLRLRRERNDGPCESIAHERRRHAPRVLALAAVAGHAGPGLHAQCGLQGRAGKGEEAIIEQEGVENGGQARRQSRPARSLTEVPRVLPPPAPTSWHLR